MIHTMGSDQGGNEEYEGKDGDNVGFGKHGADDGRGAFVGGDLLSSSLEGEANDNQEGDDKILHDI